MRFGRVRLALVVTLLSGCDGASRSQPIQPFVPDSILAAGARDFDSTIAAMRDSGSTYLDTLRARVALEVHMSLGRLGFANGPFDAVESKDLITAVNAYQRSRGLGTTPSVLDGLSLSLLRRDVRASEIRPQLPVRVVQLSSGAAFVRGAWVFDGMGGQLQAVSIFCYRANRECEERIAAITPFMGTEMLEVLEEDYRVTRWDEHEIEAVAELMCVRYTLRINGLQESATKIRSLISSSPSCSHLDRVDLVVRLVSGPELASAATDSVLLSLNLGTAARRLLRLH